MQPQNAIYNTTTESSPVNTSSQRAAWKREGESQILAGAGLMGTG